MKKMKILGLALLVACVGTVGFAGCTNTSQPYDLFILNAQKEFSIGDDFALGEDFKLGLQFHTDKKMILDNKNAIVDKTNKVIRTVDYTVDYKNFDSSKGGEYTISVTFNDHDLNPDNDLEKLYQVTVNLNKNSWDRHLSVRDWHYGQFTEEYLTTPVAKYLNRTVKYSYKKFNQTNYTEIANNELYTVLAGLNEGAYSLKATCPQTQQYMQLEDTYEFLVSANLIPSEVVIPADAGSKSYTGEALSPDLDELAYYCNIVKESGNWTDVGVYTVILTPKENWKWNDTETKDSRRLEFEITQATNEWTRTTFDVISVKNDEEVMVKGWYFGETNPYPIFTWPKAKYGTVMYKYKLTGQSDDQYSGPQTLFDLLKLDPYTYTIMAYVPSSNNFTDIEALDPIDVTVVRR